MEECSFEGKGTATDAEVDHAANEIFAILRLFDSPKDAASAFSLAHIKLIRAAFPPGYKDKAIEAVDADAQLMRDFINEGSN